MSTLEKLENLIKPIVEEEGHELVEIKIQGGKNKVVKVVLYNSDGLTIDHIADVSGKISDELDIENVLHSPYYLEVTSPGLDRPLKTIRDFKRNIGQNISVWDKESKEYTGELVRVEGRKIFMQNEDDEIEEFHIKEIREGKIKTKY